MTNGTEIILNGLSALFVIEGVICLIWAWFESVPGYETSVSTSKSAAK